MAHLDSRIGPMTSGDGQEPSPQVERLVATLDRAYRATPSPRLDASMITALQMRPSPERSFLARGAGRVPATSRRRLVSFGAALALLASGTVGYLRLSGPAPVSAQSVLSHAAAAMRLAPDQAAHLTYNVTISSSPTQADGSTDTKGPLISNADVWVQAAANGASTMSSQTLTVPEGALPPGKTAHVKAGQDASGRSGSPVLGHYLQLGRQVYGYDGGNNAIIIPGSHDQHPGWMIPNAALDGAGMAQELSVLAQHSPQQVQLLPAQTRDGLAVDVLQVNGWADAPAMRTTFYFDGQSFLLRGFDALSIDPSYPTPSWQVRLTSYTTMAASAVPQQVFRLNAPADAHVDEPRVDLDGFAATFQSTCHSSLAVAQITHLVQAKQQTLLAACQSTAPTVSTADLVGALIAPYKLTLASAAAAVQLTPAQVAAALAAHQQWLTTMVTVPGGGASLS